MISGLWGTKIGMTQVFSGNRVVPVTLINTANWLITQVKTVEIDGYSAVQFGLLKKKYHGAEYSASWHKKPALYFSNIKEVRLANDLPDIKVGQPAADFLSNLAVGDKVNVVGTTKGCGFAGVVKRHGFTGAVASHGAAFGRRPGSMSFMRSQGRVIKGKKLPGQMGNKRQMTQGLEIVNVEKDTNVVFVKGAIPGKSGSLVFIQKA